MSQAGGTSSSRWGCTLCFRCVAQSGCMSASPSHCRQMLKWFGAWFLTHKQARKYRWHFCKSGRCLWGPAEEDVSRRMVKGNDVSNQVKRSNKKE